MRLPLGDDPITTAEDDLLGREGLAEVLAAEISGLDARQGAVVAITGPWGSGKTSLRISPQLGYAKIAGFWALSSSPLAVFRSRAACRESAE